MRALAYIRARAHTQTPLPNSTEQNHTCQRLKQLCFGSFCFPISRVVFNPLVNSTEHIRMRLRR